MLEAWIVEDLSGKPGASIFYSDLAILTMATLKAVYRLAGRQCQGFVESIFELMGADLPVPDHSTLSRRLGQLSVELPVMPKEGARHVVVDSTGVKVYGEGEWKTRQMAIAKARRIHATRTCARFVSMDANTGNESLVIIVARLLKPLCFDSKRSLEAISMRVNLKIKRWSCLSSALRSTA